METTRSTEDVEQCPSPLDDHEKGEDDEPDLTKTKSLEHRVSLPREVLVIGLVSLAQFTTQVGLGGVLNITHVLGDYFNIENPGILSWLTAGYSLTVGTFILFSGRLGDIFGWKRMLVIGYSWFALWSLVLGFSAWSNHVLFVFARVFQGIGPSICLPNALALLGAIYSPGKRKNMAFAIFGGCAPSGAVVGQTFAALFALAWWPWFFWSFGIALAIIATIAALAIPDPQGDKPGIRNRSIMDAIVELDILGATFGVTALVLFNFSWNQAPIVGWSSPYVIVTLVLGILLLPAFFYIEAKLARNPLLPFDVLTTDNAFMLGCVACGWASFGIWIYYLIQILQTLRGTSPLLVAAYLSPLAIAGMIAAIATGILLSRVRPAWVMVGALCAFLTGAILAATLPPHQIYWAQLFVMTIITPFGMDMSFPSATLVISNSVDREHQGIAASLVNTVVSPSFNTPYMATTVH